MSNCDSDGIPIDHDGERLESFLPDVAPFAITGEVMREIMAGKLNDLKGSHLEAEPCVSKTQISSSGGINILDEVLVEDYESSDEPLSPVRDGSHNPTSDTVQAILRTTKHEREALFASRRKLADVLDFLRSKGFSEEDVLKSSSADGFGCAMPNRDDFGLPKPDLVSEDPFKDKMKGKIQGSSSQSKKAKDEAQVLGLTPKPKTLESVSVLKPPQEKPKSWSQVVKETEVTLDYCPLPSGTHVVCPPDEELRKGLEKFKFCVVGFFSKGTIPLPAVSSIASKLWSSRGLVSVMQKDSRKFIFKFDSSTAMNSVLAHGTWYFERKPMLVSPWGKSSEPGAPASMPIWVKLSNIPDCYWTKEGISRLASVIGKPLFADPLTSKFDALPFAKVCVQYTMGSPLPSSISAVTLDPLSEEKITVEVAVSYPAKLLVCDCCKSLGHSPGACPSVKRVWVQKTPQPQPAMDATDASVSPPQNPNNSESHVVAKNAPNSSCPDSPWTEVKRKGRAPPGLEEGSPTPPNTFKGLRNVDEVEKIQKDPAKLSKHQLKKLKKQLGKSSPSSAH